MSGPLEPVSGPRPLVPRGQPQDGRLPTSSGFPEAGFGRMTGGGLLTCLPPQCLCARTALPCALRAFHHYSKVAEDDDKIPRQEMGALCLPALPLYYYSLRHNNSQLTVPSVPCSWRWGFSALHLSPPNLLILISTYGSPKTFSMILEFL